MNNVTNWRFDKAQYKNHQYDNLLIPEGDHRVRILEAHPKTFRNGKDGFEIQLEVENHSSNLIYYMSFDYDNQQKTNQRIGAFFDSFGITDYNLANYTGWTGYVGMVHVKHNTWQNRTYANVVYCISRDTQLQLIQREEQMSQQRQAVQLDNDIVIGKPIRIPLDQIFNNMSEVK